MKNSVRCHSVRFGWYITQSSELLLRTILCGCDDNRSDHTQVPIDFSQKLMNHFGITHDLFLSIYLLASVRWSAAYYSRIVWLYLINTSMYLICRVCRRFILPFSSSSSSSFFLIIITMWTMECVCQIFVMHL